MAASTQPRVKKKRINWSKGEHAVKMTKALTYYALKKDEVGKTLTKTQLIKEAANAYGVPETTFRRRVNDNLVTNEGQGVEIPLPPLHRPRRRPQQMNIIGESKSAAKILNMPARIQKIRDIDAERQDALKKLEIYREKKAEKKRKRNDEEEKKKKRKLAWKEKMSSITTILIAANVTKPGKVSSVPQVRNYLVKKKKLARKDQKTITETNVVEKWNELY